MTQQEETAPIRLSRFMLPFTTAPCVSLWCRARHLHTGVHLGVRLGQLFGKRRDFLSLQFAFTSHSLQQLHTHIKDRQASA